MNLLRHSLVVPAIFWLALPRACQTPDEEIAKLKARVKELEAENAKLKQALATKSQLEAVKAWTDAGASVAWVRMNHVTGFVDDWPTATEGEAGIMPAFRFTWWKIRDMTPKEADQTNFGRGNALRKTWDLIDNWKEDGILAKMADPGAAFGLDLAGIGYGNPVRDDGLKGLAGLKNLQWLNLGNTPVTDVGLKELTGLKNLQALSLNLTKVTDTGLRELAGLKNLQSLDLQGTQVTDAGLKHLAGLKNLKSLILSSTNVTADGVAALRKDLPACKISR